MDKVIENGINRLMSVRVYDMKQGNRDERREMCRDFKGGDVFSSQETQTVLPGQYDE